MTRPEKVINLSGGFFSSQGGGQQRGQQPLPKKINSKKIAMPAGIPLFIPVPRFRTAPRSWLRKNIISPLLAESDGSSSIAVMETAPLPSLCCGDITSHMTILSSIIFFIAGPSLFPIIVSVRGVVLIEPFGDSPRIFHAVAVGILGQLDKRKGADHCREKDGFQTLAVHVSTLPVFGSGPQKNPLYPSWKTRFWCMI
jgi:hypothetical protein